MSRYIDADKLFWEISEYPAIRVVECLEKIKEQPTADVRENVKGEWKRASGEFVFECASGSWATKCNAIECSVCGYRLPEHEQYTNNYCPNCGADMRGKNE